MSADSINPLDELKLLDQQIERTPDLEGLKPIFQRVDQMGRLHSADFEVQIAVSEIKQRLIERGRHLKQVADTSASPAARPSPSLTVPPLPPPAPKRTISIPPVPGSTPTPPAAPDAGVQPPKPRIIIPPAPVAGARKTQEGAPLAVSGDARLADRQEPDSVPSTPGSAPGRGTPPDFTPPSATPPNFPPTSGTPISGAAKIEVPAPAKPATGAPANATAANRPPGKGTGKRRAALFAVLVVVILGAWIGNRASKKRLTAAVGIQVATTPSGASVRVNGEPMCTSNCNLSMPPGNYQVTAVLDGYEAAASNITVQSGKPAALSLALQPQAQSVRVLTDLDRGKISIDDQPPVDLQDGQFVLEMATLGVHTVKVKSTTGEASFAVEIADAKQPALQGPVVAKNLIAMVVSSLGSKARVVTNGGPWKLSLNGQPQADATPDGVDLNNFQPGVDEIVLGEGKDQRNMKESFGPAPMLTAFLKSDLNIGTLIISTNEDDAKVFLNNKEYARKTQRGQVRIPAIGAVSVRVSKDGFEAVAPQTADVKKGSEVRLEFKMQALPQWASLQIRGATPGAEVLLDEKVIGTVGDDGALTSNGIKPGDHALELRRDKFVPRRLERVFRAGQAIAINGADATLAAAMGTVKLTRMPAEATIVYHRADEQQTHELKDNQLELPPGTYVFTARSQGFTEKTERVQVNAGETHPLELALAKVAVAAPVAVAPKTSGMADFEDANAWSFQNGLWTHKGAGFIPFKLTPNGTFTFAVQLLRGGNLFRGGRIRWAVQYADAKNYNLFELDKKYLWSKVIEGGKTSEREKHEHGLSDKEKSYAIQIDVTQGKLVHRLKKPDGWMVLDTWVEPGRDFTQGKFGFLVQGSDEIGLSDFQYTPK